MLKCVEIQRAPSIGTVKHSMVFIKAGVERRIHPDRPSNDGICEEGSTSGALDSGPEITIIMSWRPNTVFVCQVQFSRALFLMRLRARTKITRIHTRSDL